VRFKQPAIAMPGIGGIDQPFDVLVGIDVGLEGIRLLRHTEWQRAICAVIAGQGVAIERLQRMVFREPEGSERAVRYEKKELIVSFDDAKTTPDAIMKSTAAVGFPSQIAR
jgi:hypothetical protein